MYLDPLVSFFSTTPLASHYSFQSSIQIAVTVRHKPLLGPGPDCEMRLAYQTTIQV